ncbi:hypothetical protein BAPKO_0376 [Borreliella afzelii PKo]|nr:hypothetical protein BAPKO_0376 [Borreliella afzelii PKo]
MIKNNKASEEALFYFLMPLIYSITDSAPNSLFKILYITLNKLLELRSRFNSFKREKINLEAKTPSGKYPIFSILFIKSSILKKLSKMLLLTISLPNRLFLPNMLLQVTSKSPEPDKNKNVSIFLPPSSIAISFISFKDIENKNDSVLFPIKLG